MKKTHHWGLWVGGGAVAVGAGAIAYAVLAKPKKSSSSTTSSAISASSSVSAFATAIKGWPAPKQYGTVIGPGSGNQPNGTYVLAQAFSVTSSGTYTVKAAADDAAEILVDGVLIGGVEDKTTTVGKATKSFSVDLKTGEHELVVMMVNNDLGTNQTVPYKSGSANPTGLDLTITDASGHTVVTTASASGWHIDAYPTGLQVSSSTTHALNSSAYEHSASSWADAHL